MMARMSGARGSTAGPLLSGGRFTARQSSADIQSEVPHSLFDALIRLKVFQLAISASSLIDGYLVTLAVRTGNGWTMVWVCDSEGPPLLTLTLTLTNPNANPSTQHRRRHHRAGGGTCPPPNF